MVGRVLPNYLVLQLSASIYDFCQHLYNDHNNYCRVILDFNLPRVEFKTFVKMSPFYLVPGTVLV